jgi:hypothetical protein
MLPVVLVGSHVHANLIMPVMERLTPRHHGGRSQARPTHVQGSPTSSKKRSAVVCQPETATPPLVRSPRS